MNGPDLSVVHAESAASLLPDKPQVLSAFLRSVTWASTTRMLSIRRVSVPFTRTSGPSVADANAARDASAAPSSVASAGDTENDTVARAPPPGEVLSPHASRANAMAHASRDRGVSERLAFI